MFSNIERYILYIKNNKAHRLRLLTVFTVLSMLVAAAVFWNLKLVGIALAGETDCGLCEHIHTEECIQKTLICDAEETEHVHSEEGGCYNSEGELICDLEETAHHEHTEECYRSEYICGKEEHIHTVECYSDKSADVENAAAWEKTLPTDALTGERGKDVLLVAQSQLGYSEGSLNYTIDEEGVRRGYTRYGEWYGNPYGRWDDMFAAFCLHYAGIDEDTVPCAAGNAAWIERLCGKGLYFPAENTSARLGDIAFFDTDGDSEPDSAGIVSGITQTELYVIGGDIDGLVKEICFDINSSELVGYCLLPEEPETPEIIVSDDDGGDTYLAANTVNIKDYVIQNGGSFSLSLLDNNGNIINGGEVYIGRDYKLSLGLSLENGFKPGTYTYQIPGTLEVTPKSEQIISKNGVVFGSWKVDGSGLVTFEFFENSNVHQNVGITIDMTLQFKEENQDIDFNGDVQVTVRKDPDAPEKPVPEFRKTGRFDKNDSTEIDWTIMIQGGDGYPLTGQRVSDSIVGVSHEYNADYRKIWAEVYIGSTYYSWQIKDEAEWSDTGWSYTIPKTIRCLGCNDSAFIDESGNHSRHDVTIEDDWLCYFYFSSKVTDGNVGLYQNKAESDGKTSTADVRPEGKAGIVKRGAFEDGTFSWNIDLIIPGNDTATYFWYLWDTLRVVGADERPNQCGPEKGIVTAEYNGSTINVPYYKDATADDIFAWKYWIDPDNEGVELDFLHKCSCTEDTCAAWSDSKNSCAHISGGADGSGFCRCWTEKEDVVFHISYKSDASEEILTKYDGGSTVKNTAYLYNKVIQNGSEVRVSNGRSSAELQIPSVFRKDLLTEGSKDNSYTADFRITVNEDMENLGAANDSVTIEDTMTDTLFYIAGSMKITSVNPAGVETQLNEGEDFTVDVKEGRHNLNIEILKPGQCKYILEYSAVLDVAGHTGPIPYSNTAEVTLFGKKYVAVSDEKNLTEYTSTAETFQLTIVKCDDGDENKKLGGAEFGLYSENGSLIEKGFTDGDGVIIFATDVTGGVVFKTGDVYYVQEINAPEGYIADRTKHFFYFSDSDDSDTELKYPGISRFPKVDRIYAGTFKLKNKAASYELPETGGIELIIYAAGAALAAAAAAGMMHRARKKRRA